MNQALKMEGVNGLKPVRTDSHLGYYYKVLNPEFVTLMMNIVPDTKRLRNFVYAIDALIEIAATKGFPSGKLLNNPDIYNKPNRAAFMFNALARSSHDHSLFGVAIPAYVEAMVVDFFEKDYLKLFAEFFNATRLPFMVFVLDGQRYHITLVRNFRSVPGYSAIKFVDGFNSNEVFIPFLSSRLGD